MRTNDFSPMPTGGDGGRDLDALLHPAQAFEHPMKVVDDPDLTLAEKRAILASWASDACAVEATPALRQPPGSPRRVEFDDVMNALRALDRAGERPRPHYRRVLAQRRPGVFGRKPQVGWTVCCATKSAAHRCASTFIYWAKSPTPPRRRSVMWRVWCRRQR